VSNWFLIQICSIVSPIRVVAFSHVLTGVSPLLRVCRDLIDQIRDKTARIETKTAQLKTMAAQTDEARRLQTMPGVGPLTALAVETFAPDMASFKRGRDFAAWLGLVPRQQSSGGKDVS
jgi:transposase